MNIIAEMLDKEIERTIEDISKAKAGTDEAKMLLIKLDKLHGQRVKELETEIKSRQLTDASLAKLRENKLHEAELELKVKQVSDELELRKQELLKKDDELTEARKTRRWHTFLEFLGITAPLAVSGIWMAKSLKFEEEGKIFSSRASQWVGNFTRLFKRKG